MDPFVPYVPDDFDEFWERTSNEARAQPLDYHRRMHNDFELPGFAVERVAFRGMFGARLEGWIAVPEGIRKSPAFLWIPPYGRESLLPNQYGTRTGFVSLSFNFFGHEAFHQERYVKERGYFAEGAGSPETWIFRTMIQNALIAVRVLQSQIEVDEDRIGAMGMSQGGGMSIWLGALSPVVQVVCADMPFLGAMQYALTRNAYRYPLKELIDFMDTIPVGRETVLNTVSYFDTMNMATRCSKATQLSLGHKDPATRPDAVKAIFNALPGAKRLIEYDWGHDWHPDMVENNRSWLLDQLPSPAI